MENHLKCSPPRGWCPFDWGNHPQEVPRENHRVKNPLFRVSALKATAAEVHRVKDPLLRVSTLKATAAEVPRKYIESKMIAGRRQSALEARSQTGPTIGSPRLHAELNKRTFVGC